MSLNTGLQMRAFMLATGVAWCLGPALLGQAPAVKADRWEKNIQAFEAKDRESPPPRHANVFVGSSSVVRWKLADSFPDLPCINRGFGGSQLQDSVRYADRIVIPYQPRVVVLYAGDNDLAAGRSPESIRDDYRAFVSKIRAKLPECKIVYVAIKPSPKRWSIAEKSRAANRLIQEVMKGDSGQVFIDVWPAMLGADGQPKRELFVEDLLHMNAAGYKLWAPLVQPHLVEKAKPAEPSRP